MAAGRLSASQHRFSKRRGNTWKWWQRQQLSLLELPGLGVPLAGAAATLFPPSWNNPTALKAPLQGYF